MSFILVWVPSPFVTFAKSNAKALSAAIGRQKRIAPCRGLCDRLHFVPSGRRSPASSRRRHRKRLCRADAEAAGIPSTDAIYTPRVRHCKRKKTAKRASIRKKQNCPSAFFSLILTLLFPDFTAGRMAHFILSKTVPFSYRFCGKYIRRLRIPAIRSHRRYIALRTT